MQHIPYISRVNLFVHSSVLGRTFSSNTWASEGTFLWRFDWKILEFVAKSVVFKRRRLGRHYAWESGRCFHRNARWIGWGIFSLSRLFHELLTFDCPWHFKIVSHSDACARGWSRLLQKEDKRQEGNEHFQSTALSNDNSSIRRLFSAREEIDSPWTRFIYSRRQEEAATIHHFCLSPWLIS